MLYHYLQKRTAYFTEPLRVLEVAPRGCFTRLCASLPHLRYTSLDLVEGNAAICTDLTNAGIASSAIDLLVCFHVLEHIPDDRAAMAEIARVLRPGGRALLQVPVREGAPTDEDLDATPEEMLRRFGKDDHVRWYGMDVVERLQGAGLDVEIDRPMTWARAEVMERYALEGDDEIIFVARPAHPG